MSHPSNQGRVCVRGWHVHEVASSPDRLKTPLLKKNGRFQEVGWEEAFDYIARRLREIRDQYGPDALAFLSSPRSSNEDAYLLQKLARAVIGTNNVDHGAGVYCNNSIDVLLEMIGIPATTNSIGELAESEVILVDGVDLARRLPTIGGAVIRAKLKGAKLIVVGTRRHRVAESADLFLQMEPATETVLYRAMAKVIVDRGAAAHSFIKSRCYGYEAFEQEVRGCDLLGAAKACGVPANLIEAAALTYARAKSAAVLFSSSMEERSKDSIRAVVNLVLLTGNLGKAGAGIFALAEQNNLQGVCDVGMLPDRLPGYQRVTDPAARAQVESLWRCRLPDTPGHNARAILTGRGGGKVKGVWLCRYDPVSTATFGDVERALPGFDLVVVQHLFLTATAEYAHVILPTTAFGEEQGSFTSTDRRIQLAQQVVRPAGCLSTAWEQIVHVAQRLGADWRYDYARQVIDEIGEVVPFYSGASYDNLAANYGRQWPCTRDKRLGTRYLFGENNRQRFRFVPVRTTEVAANPENFPLTLVFGNSLYYWNQSVLIRHSETLKREYRILELDYPEGFVEINIEDAKQLGVRDGERIKLCAAGGSASATARVTPEVMRGTIFVPYFMREVEANILGGEGNGCQLVPARLEKEAA
jgi:predicted molibdopterin-dependent oxidoreductase YjgC